MALLASTVLAGCMDNGTDSSLSVINDSSYKLKQLYVTDSGDRSWGPNLISGDPLLPGDEVDIAISCDTYDVLMVDTTGAQCEVDGISLCFDDATWDIRNNTCDVFALAPNSGDPSTTPRTQPTASTL